MRRTLALLAGAALMSAASVGVGLGGVGVAYAASAKHSVPGTPGDPNCMGQTMAYLAQGNYDYGILAGPGIGNIASQTGLTVKQVKLTVEAYCAGAFVSP